MKLAVLYSFHRLLIGILRRSPMAPETAMGLILDSQQPSPELLIRAYALGFTLRPNAEFGAIRWHSPHPRAIFPMADLHVPKNLAQLMRSGRFEMRIDHSFQEVVEACSQHDMTWITPAMKRIYSELHELGVAHSVESWLDGELAGGVFGVHIGSFFVSESKFHRRDNASKVALVYLHMLLRQSGFSLHCANIKTPHLNQFGCLELSRDEFLRRLARAVAKPVTFPSSAVNRQTIDVAHRPILFNS